MQSLLKSKWKLPVVIVLIAAVLLGICFACRKGADEPLPPPDFTKPFTAKADIRIGDIKATATVNRIGDGVCDVTLISPQALNGMKFQYNGSEVIISYLGMEVAMNDDSILANAMTAAIVKAVDAAARGSGVTLKKSGKAIVMKGSNENGEFEIRADRDNGSLLSLKVPAIDLECTFGRTDDGGDA